MEVTLLSLHIECIREGKLITFSTLIQIGLGFFDFHKLYLSLGYPFISQLYYRVLGEILDIGLREMNSDRDVIDMLFHYMGLNVVALYVEKGHEALQVLCPNGEVIKGPQIPQI